MEQSYKNIDPVPGDFFSKVAVPYTKTREDAWTAIEARLADKPAQAEPRTVTMRYWLAAAAFILLLMTTGLFMRFYSVTIQAPAGVQVSQLLPDGSTAELNAGSSLSWYPHWWRFSRILRFQGEGFFKVVTGSRFEVSSPNGVTSVLGTSFSIYSRPGKYQVTCMTGQVRVSAKNKNSVVLGPDYQARVMPDGNIEIIRGIEAGREIDWLAGKFTFSAVPLRLALDEVERQYNVRISLLKTDELLYTGHFSRDREVEEVMDLICKPFGLTFVKISENTYEIR